jgi:hypothetical protein
MPANSDAQTWEKSENSARNKTNDLGRMSTSQAEQIDRLEGVWNAHWGAAHITSGVLGGWIEPRTHDQKSELKVLSNFLITRVTILTMLQNV